MKICTLLFLIDDNRILLAMKKRGFGTDRWNGIGGKVEPGESIGQAAVRECQEEISVTPIEFRQVAVHDFIFPDGTSDMQVHTFLCSVWHGEPVESDEMAPQWFAWSAIPYDDMWQDDRYWLPQVLAGQHLHTRFTFDAHEQLVDAKVHRTNIPSPAADTRV